jgi:serine/threonine-protein kinase RsbW
VSTQRVHLSIESKLDHVSLIGVLVRALATQLGYGNMDSFQIELAVVEAVNNSIEHSYLGEPNKKVDVSLAIGEGNFVLTIADDGIPMPSKVLAESDESASSDDFPEGGRGLDIIRQVMDSVTYERGSRNSLHLIKRLPSH